MINVRFHFIIIKTLRQSCMITQICHWSEDLEPLCSLCTHRHFQGGERWVLIFNQISQKVVLVSSWLKRNMYDVKPLTNICHGHQGKSIGSRYSEILLIGWSNWQLTFNEFYHKSFLSFCSFKISAVTCFTIWSKINQEFFFCHSNYVVASIVLITYTLWEMLVDSVYFSYLLWICTLCRAVFISQMSVHH